MKVLIVSHSCIVKENQKKIEALAGIKGLDITLLIPARWKETLRSITAEKTKDDRYRIIQSEVYYNGRIAKYCYPVATAVKLLKEGFDLVHIEEEPYSAAAFQFIALNKLLSRSKTVLFTWENLFIDHAFPKGKMERFVFANTDCIIAGNLEGRTVLEKKGYKGPVKVLPLIGIDAVHFCKRDEGALRLELGLAGEFVVGYIGRLVPEKGLFNLVDAVSGIDSVKCLIIGRGPLKGELLRKIRETGQTSKFVFVETVPHHEVNRYINVMDCLVLPSVTVEGGWREQFGHVLIEAMSSEVPVIGSDSGAIPEVIGGEGLIFKEKDTYELSQKIMSLMDDPGLRKSLAAKGRQKVLALFTHDRIAESTVKIWEETLSRRLDFEVQS